MRQVTDSWIARSSTAHAFFSLFYSDPERSFHESSRILEAQRNDADEQFLDTIVESFHQRIAQKSFSGEKRQMLTALLVKWHNANNSETEYDRAVKHLVKQKLVLLEAEKRLVEEELQSLDKERGDVEGEIEEEEGREERGDNERVGEENGPRCRRGIRTWCQLDRHRVNRLRDASNLSRRDEEQTLSEGLRLIKQYLEQRHAIWEERQTLTRRERQSIERREQIIESRRLSLKKKQMIFDELQEMENKRRNARAEMISVATDVAFAEAVVEEADRADAVSKEVLDMVVETEQFRRHFGHLIVENGQ